MPLARSQFRNKSRSPGPNLSTVQTPVFATSSSRAPVFHPPSYYAAAGGISRPNATPNLGASNFPDLHNSNQGALSSQAHSPSASPLDHPSHAQEVQSLVLQSTPAQSNSHMNRVSRLISRSPSRSSSNSVRRSATKKGIEKEKTQLDQRESQLVDLPLVEMQLIPTLRDTVDRMTHPPPPAARTEDSETESMDSESFSRWKASREYLRGNDPPVSPNGPQRSPGRATSRIITSSSGSTTHTLSAMPSVLPVRKSSATGVSPSPALFPLSSREGGGVHERNTPQLRSPAANAPQIPLKSALRSKASPAIQMTVDPASQPGQSLRRARPMAAKPTPSPIFVNLGLPVPNSPSKPSKEPRIRTQTRGLPSSSLKQPGSSLPVPKSKSKSRSNPGTPQNSTRFPSFATPQPPQPSTFSTRYTSNQRSALPRPAGSVLTPSDSGSGPERRLGQNIPSRRLVVTNAQVLPSSSDSEGSMRGVTDNYSQTSLSKGRQRVAPSAGSPRLSPNREVAQAQPMDQGRRRWFGLETGRVGLGFHMTPPSETPRDQFDNDTEDEDERFARAEYHSDTSQEADELEEHQRGYVHSSLLEAPPHLDSTDSLNEDHDIQRRPDALRGIMNGLQADYASCNENGRRSVLSQSESDAYYEQGLAVTVSSDFPSEDISVADFTGLPVVVEQRTQEEQSMWPDDESVYSEDDQEDLSAGEDIHQMPAWRRSPQPTTDWSNGLSSSGRGVNDSSLSRCISPVTDSAMRNLNSRSGALSPIQLQEEVRGSSILPNSYKRSSSRRDSTKEPQQSPSKDVPPETRRTSLVQNDNFASRRRSTYENEDIKTPRMSSVARYDSFIVSATPMNSGATNNGAVGEDLGERERQAFGIPRSLSFGAVNSLKGAHADSNGSAPFVRSESEDSLNGGLPHVDSDLSSVDDDWQEPITVNALSKGAHVMLETLANGDSQVEVNPRASRSSKRDEILQNQDAWSARHDRSPSHLRSDDIPASSTHSNSQNIHQPHYADSASAMPSTSADWCSSIQPSLYEHLLSQHGELEMQRQDAIYQLLSTEKDIVKRLRAIVRSFILPLRGRNSKSWLSGVPQAISRLFDWLEDILNLHTDIARTLKEATRSWQSGEVVESVAGSLLPLMPRLEVYQPYLVRVDEVKEMVTDWVNDERSEFGEYVRLREQEGECDGQTLEQLLEEPVRRLIAYPAVFERLLELTPKRHPDYLGTVSLLCMTQTVIRVLEEVRVREEEYDFVKDVASRIHGLSVPAELAKRERRLLHHGIAHGLVPIEDVQVEAVPIAPAVQLNGKTLIRSKSRMERIQRNSAQRASQLASAIHNWHIRRARFGSISSISSSSLSIRSHDTTISNSTLATPTSDDHSRSYHGDLKRPGERAEIQALQVFVFTDLLMLATRVEIQEDITEGEDHWQLLDGVGLSRILGVRECQGVPGNNFAITVDLIPLDVNELNSSFHPQGTLVKEVSLILPPAAKDSAESWLAAFQQCQEATIHYLSIPPQMGSKLSYGTDQDLQVDTYHSVRSILASGLPLPKSPSMQLNDMSTYNSDATEQEREERGWWSLRFQQVLREFQRQDRSAWPSSELF